MTTHVCDNCGDEFSNADFNETEETGLCVGCFTADFEAAREMGLTGDEE